jgi:hypothetical protein
MQPGQINHLNTNGGGGSNDAAIYDEDYFSINTNGQSFEDPQRVREILERLNRTDLLRSAFPQNYTENESANSVEVSPTA